MRVHIRPAHPDATIPDPARRRDLPPEGLPCDWSVHWARLAARGDVIVTDLSEGGEPESLTTEAGDVVHVEGEPAPYEGVTDTTEPVSDIHPDA